MRKYILLFAMMLAVGGVKATITNVKYATFGNTGSNAKYDASTGTFTWTANSDNLMPVFTFSNGELANFTQLKFTFAGESGNLRVNFVCGNENVSWNGNDGEYFGSTGTKTITMTSLAAKLPSGKTLADVTAIRIGGHSSSNTGSRTFKWSDVYLENDDDAVVTGVIGDIAGNSGASYNGLNATYNWTNAGSANLMAIFSGSAGDFSKYSEGVLQVKFTLDDNTNAVRVGYHYGSTFTEFGSGYYSSGTKQIDLSTKSSDAATATAIRFGARSAKNSATSGTVDIRPDEMFLVRSEAYTRSFTANQKSTVWLPFALTADEVAAVKGKFYELTAASSGNLTFTEVTGATEAYKPYVFVASETCTPFSEMKSKTIVAPKTCAYTVGDFTFVGSMKNTTVPDKAYGYNSTNGTFSRASGTNVTIEPFRAYIIGSADANAARLSTIFSDDESTGIMEVKQIANANQTLYNLAGQRVSEGHKGLVVKNGRKYMIK